MSSNGGARIACVEIRAKRLDAGARPTRNVIRLFAVALAGALLASCARSPLVSNFGSPAASRQASLPRDRTTSIVTNSHVAATKKHAALATASRTQIASQGLASFYKEGTLTASGEKFDPHELTAAHPTLPFGTRLRVTSVSTGRSVTVRVNDRGPYVPGRIVDVSYSAADALGMVGRGVANVRLDVVR